MLRPQIHLGRGIAYLEPEMRSVSYVCGIICELGLVPVVAGRMCQYRGIDIHGSPVPSEPCAESVPSAVIKSLIQISGQVYTIVNPVEIKEPILVVYVVEIIRRHKSLLIARERRVHPRLYLFLGKGGVVYGDLIYISLESVLFIVSSMACPYERMVGGIIRERHRVLPVSFAVYVIIHGPRGIHPCHIRPLPGLYLVPFVGVLRIVPDTATIAVGIVPYAYSPVIL